MSSIGRIVARTAAVASATALSLSIPRADAPAPAVGTPSPQDRYIHLDLSKVKLEHHLLHATMSGEDKLEEYKLYLSKDKTRVKANARLGNKACGHPHIVHGGAISALFDDVFGALFLSSGRNGFTANLSINYKKPLPAGTDMVLHATLDRVELSKTGKEKVFLKGVLVDAADSTIIYTEASALFIGKQVELSKDSVLRPLKDSIEKALDESSGDVSETAQ